MAQLAVKFDKVSQQQNVLRHCGRFYSVFFNCSLNLGVAFIVPLYSNVRILTNGINLWLGLGSCKYG